ncbi:MAG TPA: hypothetical protein VGC89_00410 [Pyrinomonadaceae bacterium]|jgi:hypothetical protein
MVNASLLSQQKLFGLFELDPAGNVLYSRIEPDGDNNAVAPDVAGRNFFDDVAPQESAEELRRRITVFTHSEVQADNFHFSCQCGDGPLLVKVLLARICERSNGRQTKSILVHIRKI